MLTKIRSYSGPGITLALRINEYGTIIIGLVGNAKYGPDCWLLVTNGLFGVAVVATVAASGGLRDSPRFNDGGFGVELLVRLLKEICQTLKYLK